MGAEMTDLPSPGGWLQTYGVRVYRALVLGGVGAAVVLSINGHTDYVQTGTETGSILAVNGVTQQQIAPTRCALNGTATGGLANYDFCRVRSPYTTTGAMTAYGLECGNVPR